jgi:hypothetical protein
VLSESEPRSGESGPRRPGWFIRPVLAGLLGLLLAGVVVFGLVAYLENHETPVSGFVQTISRASAGVQAAGWVDVCGTATNRSTCLWVGGMATIGDSASAIVTYSNGGTPPSAWGFGLLNLTTGTWQSRVSTTCEPYHPYYPDSGDVVYIPCYARNGTVSVSVFDYETGEFVANISVPTGIEAWGSDPQLNFVYLGLANGRLLAVNGTNFGISADRPIDAPSNSSGFGVWSYLSWDILYDPYANVLISQTGSSQLIALDPNNLTLVGAIVQGTTSWATSIDDANRQVYVATDSGALLAFNATSLHQVANLTIPSSACSSDNEPFLADEMISNPVPGELYLIGFTYCLGVVNTTGDYWVATLSWGGDGYGFGVYDPATSDIWVYYPSDPFVGPLFVGQLSYSTYSTVSSVLGLSPLGGELLLTAAVWVAGAGASYATLRVYRGRVASKAPQVRRK